MSTPLTVWWGGLLAEEFPGAQGEVLVVLAGSSLEGGILGESSYWRCVYALLVWREGRVRQIVLVGNGDGRPASEAMRDFLAAHGVPSGAMILETASRSTRENALFVKPILAALPGRKVLLTSDYHLFRARRVFERLDIPIEARALPDARKRGSSWRGRWSAFQELCGESAKIVYYRLQGWI